MEPTRQQIIDDLIHDAHFADERIITAEVAARFVDELRNLEGSGVQWIGDYLDDLARKGAVKVYTDWRRRHRIPATTKKGTELEIPAYASVREIDDDGSVTYVQLALAGMTLDQLKDKRDRMARTRDTLSAEVRLLSDLIEIMESDASLATAGDALARLAA